MLNLALVASVLDLLGGSLVQADVSHCLCLAPGTWAEAGQSGSPSSPMGGASIVQRLGLPGSHTLNVPVLSYLPSWSGWFEQAGVGVVSPNCRRGDEYFLSLQCLSSAWLVGTSSLTPQARGALKKAAQLGTLNFQYHWPLLGGASTQALTRLNFQAPTLPDPAASAHISHPALFPLVSGCCRTGQMQPFCR